MRKASQGTTQEKEYQLLRVPIALWLAIKEDAFARHLKTPERARNILGEHFAEKINKSASPESISENPLPPEERVDPSSKEEF